jgi:CRP-like cAMP-binding protein
MATEAIHSMAGCWLPTLHGDTLVELAMYGSARDYAKGAQLYRAGAPVAEALLVQEGLIRVWCETPRGPETRKLASQGDLVGLAPVFHAKPQCATAEAVTDVRVIALSLGEIRRVMAECPALRLPLLAVLSEETTVKQDSLGCVWQGGGQGHCGATHS